MSTYYNVYTEAKIDGKWRCIDGYLHHVPYGEDKEELCLSTLYFNGSRSYFSDAYDRLREIGEMVPFSALSEEVKKEWTGMEYEEYFWNPGEPKKETRILTVSLDSFKASMPKGYECHGVCHKDTIVAYENGDIGEPYDESREVDLSKLTQLEQNAYLYYEWDSPYSWNARFKEIKKNLDVTLEKYFDMNYVTPEKIRLVIILS